MDQVYYAETICQAVKKDGVKCNNKAYYVSNSLYVCGVHSTPASRIKLPINPNKKANTEIKHQTSERLYLDAQERNRQLGMKGRIICTKMLMRKEISHVEGYMSVFPNKKHGNRQDGLGLPALSPMNLGPVVHSQPGLPQALNLENFWQSSKLFPNQVLDCGRKDHTSCGDNCFRKYQIEMFNNPVAERHNKHAKVDGKKVQPLGWIWTLSDETTKLFKYKESRQFYCCFYERLARVTDDYMKLVDLLRDGMNLNIIGYDGRDIRNCDREDLKDLLAKWYLDESHPFGHELCIVAMLIFEEDELPWRKHKTEEF
ncbi:Hypothetical protein POVR1_LOCUS227 [uncultured virus]|nr:Hypothetical protein POVR1_LOCUS227 [uncultured virus]